MAVLPQLMYRFGGIPVEFLASTSAYIDNLNLEFIWKCKRPVTVKTNPNQNKKLQRDQSCQKHTSFSKLLQIYSSKRVYY